MIDIAEITPQLLATLGEEMGGCIFEDESQITFLRCIESCDVQAAPGNGKTTLLVAKLALLARTWSSRTAGVCVISHTNAARHEVETKLVAHPGACAFLSYPHFIGTVTTFIHQYLALPYLRGLGWKMRQVDDEAFEHAALGRLSKKPNLMKVTRIKRGALKNQVSTWVTRLVLAHDFSCDRSSETKRLKVQRLKRQHGPGTACGGELEELKAELVSLGLFRFADMTVLANRALDVCPSLAERLRQRFPMVLLDEAQDTNGEQMKLLDRVFGSGVAYQRLGDQNQTIYEDSDLGREAYWRSGEKVVPLDRTRRFGAEIASFASRLTVRRKQQIEGDLGKPNHRALFLFDSDSIRAVLPAYAREIRDHWAGTLAAGLDLWAVASRHNLYREKTKNWPKSLVDYHPAYRSSNVTKGNANGLCRMMQKASALHAAGKSPAELVELLGAGVAHYLDLCGFKGPNDRKPTNVNIWRLLNALEERAALRVRRLFRDRVMLGKAAWDASEWGRFCVELREVLRLPDPPVPKASDVSDFLRFNERDAGSLDLADRLKTLGQTTLCGVVIKLGSIHSVKGRSVDAILVLESEIRRGSSEDKRRMDLATVLPHAFGLEDRDFAENEAERVAATNVFVAVSRPRRMLCLALRKEAASEELVRAALQQGWYVRDLTEPVDSAG